ncbi:exo-beta-N-acetylmuramidase NamZ domain-containing protein [Pricia sp.]|uniref:exo-beta-N-acetylmuramidase NamZ family protein n=1 Tax=Pricia sp. TaxID=2268138 RepID=UPI003593725C
MVNIVNIKSTFFILFLAICACGNPSKSEEAAPRIALAETDSLVPESVIVAANRTKEYLSLLEGKKVGVVANQTSVIFKEVADINPTSQVGRQEPRDKTEDGRQDETRPMTDDGRQKAGYNEKLTPNHKPQTPYTHLVDSLLSLNVNIPKVFAPEHGFRGEADAGEKVKDGVDAQTGLPLISLYGKNRKPSAQQLKGLDVVLFDIQDVGVRFYTYIATLQLVMEACAENNVPIIVLDRPNPNANYIDGPTMEAEHTGFLGMTEIPLVYGMTIGEYAKMINEEGWLEGKKKADLTVIPLENWNYNTEYHLPIRPSPNLPDDTSITLYPSLGLFEGTNVNAGRGTEFQFQRYGASFLDSTQYSFRYTPMPNFGSKTPKEEGKKCFGKDLSENPRMQEVSLQWLIDAYTNAVDKTKVFNTDGFTKHAGTTKLQQQIEAGKTEEEIKETWQSDLEKFRKIRVKYLIYEAP